MKNLIIIVGLIFSGSMLAESNNAIKSRLEKEQNCQIKIANSINNYYRIEQTWLISGKKFSLIDSYQRFVKRSESLISKIKKFQHDFSPANKNKLELLGLLKQLDKGIPEVFSLLENAKHKNERALISFEDVEQRILWLKRDLKSALSSGCRPNLVNATKQQISIMKNWGDKIGDLQRTLIKKDAILSKYLSSTYSKLRSKINNRLENVYFIDLSLLKIKAKKTLTFFEMLDKFSAWNLSRPIFLSRYCLYQKAVDSYVESINKLNQFKKDIRGLGFPADEEEMLLSALRSYDNYKIRLKKLVAKGWKHQQVCQSDRITELVEDTKNVSSTCKAAIANYKSRAKNINSAESFEDATLIFTQVIKICNK